ncbi:MAG: hypothetical protein QXK69_06130 [Candidatus Caldarchaeum sp.]
MPSRVRRGWPGYNGVLVGRADLLFSFDVLDEWDEELESVNDGMVGAPYRCPDSFIGRLVDMKHFVRVGYRHSESSVQEG